MVEKSQGERELELLDSLKIIRDMIKGISMGKSHLFIPLCGQLRALLFDGRKKKDGSENKHGNVPLLISIAEEISYEIKIYGLPSVDKSELPFPEDLESFYIKPEISMYKENPMQREFTIKDWLNLKILESISRERGYTIIEVIKFYADQAGGAHYDPIISEDFAELRKYGRMYDVMFESVVVTAQVVYEIGLDIMRKLCNFDFYFLLGIPHQTIQQVGFIFDAKHANTGMRITLCLDNFLKPIFRVTSVEGLEFCCHCKRLIDWSEPRSLNLTFEVLDNLGVRTSIFIDGELVAYAEGNEMIFVSNDITSYKRYFNRSFVNEDDGLIVGLGSIILYGRSLNNNHIEKFLCLNHFAQVLKESDGICSAYKKGLYKYLPSGETDYSSGGNGVMWNLNQLCAGILPESFDESI